MSSSFSAVRLECRKFRRTGLIPAFLAGGVLAAAFPILNMAVRSQMYTAIPQTPVKILLDANWQMMVMLNMLLLVAGACLMYHTEYADHAIQKMCMLPIRESSLYFCKALLMAGLCILVLALEAAAVIFSSLYWFDITDPGSLAVSICQNFAWFFLLMLPAALASLGIASACENMWITLGIGVVCVFTATLLPTGRFALALFPFALPFQILEDLAGQEIWNYIAAACMEIAAIALVERLFLRARRKFS